MEQGEGEIRTQRIKEAIGHEPIANQITKALTISVIEKLRQLEG